MPIIHSTIGNGHASSSDDALTTSYLEEKEENTMRSIT
jgi:hypothetical protein